MDKDFLNKYLLEMEKALL